MKRYRNKREVEQTWTVKISAAKSYWDDQRKAGAVQGSFYQTPVYGALDRRRSRALWRYDHWEEIAAQRKVRRGERKAKESEALKIENKITATFDGNAIDAFKGRRAVADLDFALALNPENFVGRLEVYESGSDMALVRKTYTTIPPYFKAIAAWVRYLFSQADGYAILEATVEKKHTYDPATKTLYYFTTIYLPEE